MSACGRVLALVLALLCSAVAAMAIYPAPPHEGGWAEGEILVKFAPGAAVEVGATVPATTGIAAVDQELALHGAQSVERVLTRTPSYARLALGSVFRSHDGSYTQVPDLSRWYRIVFPPQVDEEALARTLSGLADIEAATPNHFAHTLYMPSDEYLEYQYAVHNTGQEFPAVLWGGLTMDAGLPDADLDLPEAWDLTTAADTVIVAVIDTGIDYYHPDIVANLWINTGEVPADSLDNDENGYIDDIYGYNFKDDHGDPWDDIGHGTHVGGTISAVGDNGVGVVGGAYNVKIMSCKFLNGGTSEDAAEAIVYAVDNGARVLNNSWGGPDNQMVTDAINYAVSQGALVFAAAGNAGGNFAQSPASVENAIAVAATECRDLKAGFSCYGEWVEMSAPGVNILSLRADSTDMFASAGEPLVHIFPYPDGEYYLSDGTSMACPHACATAAMVMSYYPYAAYEEVVGRVLAGCDPIDELNPGYAGLLGAGRTNVYNSLTVACGPHLIFVSCDVDDSSGNGDGRLDPGETASLTVRLRNMWQDAHSLTAELSCDEPAVSIVSGLASYGDIGMMQIKGNDFTPYVVELDQSYTAGDFIEFSLAMESPDRYSETLTFRLRTHTSELPGWPVSTPGNLMTCPATGHFSSDSHPEVAVAILSHGLHIYDYLGNLLPGFPVSFGTGFPSDAAAVGDVDGNGRDEVVLGTWSNEVHIIDGDGNSLPGWPITVPHKVYATPVLYDIDDDLLLEVIVGCNDAKVYVFDSQGDHFPGWPREMDAGTAFAKVKAAPCVGDVDGLGATIVVGAAVSGKVYAWNADGTGYINPDGFFAQTDTSNMRVSPVMADLDSDGRLEIVIADDAGKVYVWNDDGTALAGWPLDVGGPHNGFFYSPSIADIDSDGLLELLICSKESAIWAWEADGTDVEGWPVRPAGDDPMYSAPVVANVDGDRYPEIMACGPEPYVSAYNGGGTGAVGWPADIGGRAYTVPTVDDLDNDGDPDVIVASYTAGLHAIDAEGGVVSGPGWWPTYRYNGWRTGTIPIGECTGVVGASGRISLSRNFPNPFNPETTLELFLPRPGKASLAIYDVSGRKVASVLDEWLEAGAHTAGWDGRDRYGNAVASGIYFVKLEACGQERRTRIALLR